MKLIIAQPYLTLRGGVERVVLKIAEHYNAKILTMEYDKNSTFEGFGKLDIEIISKNVPFSSHLPYRASQGLRYGYTFYNLKLKDDYDVINAHIAPSEWIRNKNRRVLWYCHTPPREVYDLYSTRMQGRSYADKVIYSTFTKAYKVIANKVVTKLEGIATNSNFTKAKIKEYFKRDATVINPGIDVDEYSNNGDEKFFLYPSRIILTKRQDYAIDAFSRFMKKSKLENYKLVVAGTLSKDKEHQAYFEKLKAMQVKNVVFKTNISDSELKSLYSRATAILYPPINEDFGIVPLEGMASSKPVIAVDEGGPRETMVDGSTGYLVNSPDQMAERMKELVENASLAEQLGAEGRRKVEKNYTWQSFFSKFDQALAQVAEKNGKGH